MEIKNTYLLTFRKGLFWIIGMSITKELPKTVYFLFPYIGMELYGFFAIVSLYFFFCFLCLLDVAIGYLIARQYKTVCSRSWSAWFLSKVIWMILLAAIIGFMANISFQVKSDTVTWLVSFVIWSIVTIRAVFEVVSILENLAIISTKRESETLLLVIEWINRIIGIWKETINSKIKRYEQDLTSSQNQWPTQPNQT